MVRNIPTNRRLTFGEPESSNSKRRFDEPESSNSKRRLKEKVVGDADLNAFVKGKGVADAIARSEAARFQRIWSSRDELTLLQGLIVFEKRSNPTTFDFYKFIIHSLDFSDADIRQVHDKIRKLRVKYADNLFTKNTTFSSHEKAVFDLSRIIWGEIDAKSVRESVPMRADITSVYLGKSSLEMIHLNENVVTVGLQLCSEAKRCEMADEWSKWHIEESELLLKKMILAQKEAKMILAAYLSAFD